MAGFFLIPFFGGIIKKIGYLAENNIMTPKTFFTILIKVVGLYLLFYFFITFFQTITAIVTILNLSYGNSIEAIISAFGLMVMMILYAVLLKYIFFKTDFIIKKLALDQHFEEETFAINIHRSTILSIAVIVSGAVFLMDGLPHLVSALYTYAANKPISAYQNTQPSLEPIIFNSAKVFIGFILINHNRAIVNFIENNSRKKADG